MPADVVASQPKAVGAGARGIPAGVSGGADDALTREMERELEEFRRMGDRVQSLADKAAAVSGWTETVQYGALLKPLFSNMESLMTKLRADPTAAAAAQTNPTPAVG